MSKITRDATINFRLPKKLRDKIEKKARQAQSRSLADYLIQILEREIAEA